MFIPSKPPPHTKYANGRVTAPAPAGPAYPAAIYGSQPPRHNSQYDHIPTAPRADQPTRQRSLDQVQLQHHPTPSAAGPSNVARRGSTSASAVSQSASLAPLVTDSTVQADVDTILRRLFGLFELLQTAETPAGWPDLSGLEAANQTVIRHAWEKKKQQEADAAQAEAEKAYEFLSAKATLVIGRVLSDRLDGVVQTRVDMALDALKQTVAQLSGLADKSRGYSRAVSASGRERTGSEDVARVGGVEEDQIQATAAQLVTELELAIDAIRENRISNASLLEPSVVTSIEDLIEAQVTKRVAARQIEWEHKMKGDLRNELDQRQRQLEEELEERLNARFAQLSTSIADKTPSAPPAQAQSSLPTASPSPIESPVAALEQSLAKLRERVEAVEAKLDRLPSSRGTSRQPSVAPLVHRQTSAVTADDVKPTIRSTPPGFAAGRAMFDGAALDKRLRSVENRIGFALLDARERDKEPDERLLPPGQTLVDLIETLQTSSNDILNAVNESHADLTERVTNLENGAGHEGPAQGGQGGELGTQDMHMSD